MRSPLSGGHKAPGYDDPQGVAGKKMVGFAGRTV